MPRIAIAFAAAGATVALPATALAQGKLRICRYPASAVSVSDGRNITIPAGTVFTSGDDPRSGDGMKPFFTVRTTAVAVVPPKPGCALAPAEMLQNPAGYRLRRSYPAPLPSQLSMPGVSLAARVVADLD